MDSLEGGWEERRLAACGDSWMTGARLLRGRHPIHPPSDHQASKGDIPKIYDGSGILF
jgi:hypothetical protein